MNGRTRFLLLGGLLAGPFFTLAWFLGAIGRQDYSALRHPISSLSIGSAGWTQTAAFLITGMLMLAFAVGVRGVFRPRGLSRWAAVFLAAAGVGLVGAGLFVTDPMNGYPPGTPLVPTDFTVPGRLHRAFSALFFGGLPLSAFSFARWFSRQGHSTWATYSRASAWGFLAAFVVTTVAFLGVGGLDDMAGLLQRFTLVIGWAWVTLLAYHLQKIAPRDVEPPRDSEAGLAREPGKRTALWPCQKAGAS
ncbi:MAG: DUF998 domain-containing protein [Anaerolineales bacterium]|nr:DUF998 domain-containing protein [Anaerolineales bacterium]